MLRSLFLALLSSVVVSGLAVAQPPSGNSPDGKEVVWVWENPDREWLGRWYANRNAVIDGNRQLAHDPTSILIQFRPEATAEQVAAVLAGVKGKTIQKWGLVPGLHHVAIDGIAVDAALKAVRREAGPGRPVVFAEPDLLGHIGATPNDTHYGLLWGMNNSGQTVNGDPGIAGADIDANLAWDVTTGSATVVVGMADSGIRATHEDLAANIWTNPGETAGNNIDDDGNGRVDDTWGWDFWNNDNNPTDDNGHGTHTSGTVGAVGNNGKGVAGVCWTVRLAGLKIGSRQGSVSVSAGVSAINYCVGKGIKVANHSWGGTGFSSSMDAAITSARTAGHMLVCAAGNSGINNDATPFYPASYTQDNIIAVASTTNNDTLSSFSNYGLTRVDLGAPGSTIVSTYISRNSNNAYAYLSGTSMSAPHVTGTAALVWSVNPSWDYSQVRSKILSTVRPIPALSGKTVTGGILNANNAVR
jgi:subtilisin family serine protease